MTAANLYAIVEEADATELQWFPALLGGVADLTFDLCPEYDLPVTYRRRGIQTPADGGMVQRRTIWTEGDLRTFTLGWQTMNSAEVARLRNLWASTRGPVLAMNYTPPFGADAIVRFKEPYLRLSPRGPESWAVEIQLEEVR